MTDESILASIRFGTGRSPEIADPDRPEDLLDPLAGPDFMAAAFPIKGLDSIGPEVEGLRIGARLQRSGDDPEAAAREVRRLRRGLADRRLRDLQSTMARGLDTRDPLRERLTWFWADHFTTVGKAAGTRTAVSIMVEEAVRPHVAGRFGEMLRAVVTHPAMLLYLNQSGSVGPNSRFGQRATGRGLNENLAREVLELHTLGVDGTYDQHDVRQLAELFTGMTASLDNGFRFRPQRREPGQKVILGTTYGGRTPRIEDVHAVLDDLAHNADTARHIAWKLAVHFVSDSPEPALVDALAAEFAASNGDLLRVYEVLLTHPSALQPELRKVKPPFDFILTALRAIGMRGAQMMTEKKAAVRGLVVLPMIAMGQPWQVPPGPDGWPEESGHWITPQGLAARIGWTMSLQERRRLSLPDSRDLVDVALGSLAGTSVRRAAAAAETRGDGVGLVLASPEFQRR